MLWVWAFVAYILGSVPFGLIVARLHGVDLRGQGSGNIGATNALRVMGRKAGALTLLGDLLKGSLAVWLALYFSGREAGIIAAAAAVLGHDFSVFAGFKGGKGVATSFGVLLALEPVLAAIGFGAWILTVLAFRYSSLGALVSFGLLPLWCLILKGGDRTLMALAFFLTALIFFKHRGNIGRLVRGEESRVGKPS